MICRGQLDSGESCIVLQSGPTGSLVATFPPCSVVTCSMRILCCRGRTLQMRPRTGVCEPLMPDVMSPKVHQNNYSYVSTADLPSDSLRENLAWWVVTRRTLKNHKTVKIGGWVLAQVWALARDITVCLIYTFFWRTMPPDPTSCWQCVLILLQVFGQTTLIACYSHFQYLRTY